MPTTPVEQLAVRERVLAVLERILGYQLDPATEQLTDLDSLQVLELLVSLEEEFDIDSDRIIESQPDWWASLSTLVASISALKAETQPEESKQG
ncbi:phosphopantetheine-binding protein [Streptomyces sp. NBC_00683]|uniref:phosphopantetheine-binding protein n=1 Tax=Streptomyces sp. NBC_00683 TaxID=2903670 RepID=UPI002E2EB2D3|nr:phosphopantetheine-binding protein [Streptomyces sp. NBC_00683]